MIEFQHAWAITLRHIRQVMHDVNAQIAILFWPLLNIVIWGYLGLWMQHNNNPLLQTALLSSIFLWELFARGSIMISLSLLEELWSNNITSLFATPLRLSEWILGTIIFSGLTTLFTAVYCFCLIKLLYGLPAGLLMHIFLLFTPPLFIASIATGLLALQVVLYRGKRAAEFVFLAVWIIAPLSGVFYPREVLPVWAQRVGDVLPMSYIFAAQRNYILYQQDPFKNIVIGYLLGIMYCIVALLLFAYSFRKTKKAGLARLMD